MTARRTLGGRLARIVALSTLAGLLAFALIGLAVLWFDEKEPTKPDEESAFDELMEHFAFAFAIAAPAGIAIAVIAGRWSTRNALTRVDALISNAGRVDLDNLGFRLAESPADDELDALTRALNSLLQRIDDGVSAQRQFAGDASHELRTPLAVMISSLEVARRRSRSAEEWERIVDETLSEARRLADLAEALLQLSRIGAHAVHPTTLDVDRAVAAIIERWRPRATSAEVQLVLRADCGASINADERAFDVAISNLLDNAIAISPRGTTIEVDVLASDRHVEIGVDDQGPGVATSDRLKIFAPFTRGERPPQRAGVGLGLSIVKRICDALGGTIRVEAGARGGALFVVQLPRDHSRHAFP